jgi:hypothetical protein
MGKRGRDYGIPGESDRTKKLSTRKLRTRVLTVFQKLRRLEEANEHGRCRCVTCGKVAMWNDGIEGGHYISRQHNATAFLSQNLHPQCTGCNRSPGGKSVEHRAYIVQRYGEEVAAELDRLKDTTVQLYRIDYLEMLAEFNQRVKELQRLF